MPRHWLALVSLLALITSCRSLNSRSRLAHETPIERSYAVQGRVEVQTAYRSLLETLTLHQDHPSDTAPELLQALNTWRETLSLFVHLFPTDGPEDTYLDLLREADYGAFLAEQASQPNLLLKWTEDYQAALNKGATITYLQDLNLEYASRRRNDLVPRPYWFGVNFIPALREAFTSNWKDYLRAQRKALRDDIARADHGDPLFPEQAVAIGHVISRCAVLIRLRDKFQAVDEDPLFSREINGARDFYSRILDDLKLYTSLREKNDTRASVLGRKIRADWVNEMARKQTSQKPQQ